MLLRTLYDEKLAQASYLLGCQATGEAMIVDPNRDVDQYMKAATKEGLRISHVTETHIHADFVSGSRELAYATGAQLLLSGHGGTDWTYGYAESIHATVVRNAYEFMVGNIRVQVLHTPGHTPEHISFLITDTKVTNQPMGIFSGDFVFVGDVGRPDLLEKAAGVGGTMRDGARDLYRSIERFRALPDYLQVWPGHGAGSACGKALGAVPQSTVGYEKLFSPAFSFKNEDDFIDYILSGQPDPPKYFAKMKYLNRDGPPVIGAIPTPQKIEAEHMKELMAEGIAVVDTRQAGSFSRAHVPGTINIPFNKSFTNWAGWLLPYDKPFALIVDERTSFSVHDMARDLTLIGLENAVGYFTSDVVDTWPEPQSLANMTTAQIEQSLKDSNVHVLDVRGKGEWDAGHIPGVPNIPVGYLVERQDEIPKDKKIVVHCQSGSRSAIASSVLQSLGYDVVNVRGGFDEWASSSRPVEVA